MLSTERAIYESQSSLRQNHRLKSRMREIRKSGSEGGGAQQLSLPLLSRA